MGRLEVAKAAGYKTPEEVIALKKPAKYQEIYQGIVADRIPH